MNRIIESKDVEDESLKVVPRHFQLPPYTELRLVVSAEQRIKLELTRGRAEIFGAQLLLKEGKYIRNCKVAIFAWEESDILVDIIYIYIYI